MSYSSPPAEQANVSCPINGLADSVLEEIFEYLQPYERLIISEVCRRWHSISRKAWFDISKIDLTPIPGKHIRAIVNQCPNLQSVFAVDKSFDSNELAYLAKLPSLTRLSLLGCEFKLNSEETSVALRICSDSLAHSASWTEFVLHGAKLSCASEHVNPLDAFVFDLSFLPASITQLQLSDLGMAEAFNDAASLSLHGLERLENLECFILRFTPIPPDLPRCAFIATEVFEEIARLKTLRELCIGPALWLDEGTELAALVSSLPKLEVLFLDEIDGDDSAEELAEIMTANSALRILVLTGIFFVIGEPIELPARKRYPRGFGSDPLPLLQVFVGKQASERIRFRKSTSDAAIIYPINQPMPEFLAREDIAAIFTDVWVAEKIKEMAKHGGKLWHHDIFDRASSIQHA